MSVRNGNPLAWAIGMIVGERIFNKARKAMKTFALADIIGLIVA